MKINKVEKSNKVKFKDLKHGDCFLIEEELYIKFEYKGVTVQQGAYHCNAISINNFSPYFIVSNKDVVPVDAEINYSI